MKDKINLMRAIQEADFDLTDTALYLDMYPESSEALEHFYEIRKNLGILKSEYEKKYGPLTFSANNATTWNWTDMPWPWECEVN